VGVVTGDGTLLSRLEQPTDARRGARAVLTDLQLAIRQVQDSLGRIEGIGVACAGQIQPDTGAVVHASNLGWRDVPLGPALRETFSVPVAVENDVRAAAWGEFRFGAGQGAGSLVTVFVGTGVGSGAVIDGRLWRGAGNAAGELGHTQVVAGGLACPCGQRGCLEQYVSGNGFARRLEQAIATGAATRLADLVGRDPSRLTADMVSTAAAEGDPLAREIWDDAIRSLTMALANYVTLLNPEVLVLGGGVLDAAPKLADLASAGVLALTTPLARASLRIDRARLGDWSGVVGAAALARER
jgi:glucokinase